MSMESTFGERIAVLESEVRLLRADQSRVLEKLESISIKLNSHQPCPDPGACVRLMGEISDVARKVEVLEADRNQRKGERGIIAIICTLLGAGVSVVVNWLISPK